MNERELVLPTPTKLTTASLVIPASNAARRARDGSSSPRAGLPGATRSGAAKGSPLSPASEYRRQAAEFEREAGFVSRIIEKRERRLRKDKNRADALRRRGTQAPLTSLRGQKGLLAAGALLEVQTELVCLRARFESSLRLALEYKAKAQRWQELASNPAMIATKEVRQ